MKTLWIVSGGAEAVPGIARAKQMGFHVVVSDANPEAPGLKIADDAVVASTYDVDATVQAALAYHRTVRPVDGVLCVAADVPRTVAKVAAALGLPGISLETARLASNKLSMKKRLAGAGIPVPWFSAVESVDHLVRIVRQRGLPLVLKPVDSRGARGVLRLTPEIDLAWAYDYSCKWSPTSTVMVEEFLPGPQISTESVLIDGQAFTPGFCDRNYEFLERFSPYFIENGGQQPTVLPSEQAEAVRRCAETAGRALGVHRGTVKGDLVLTPSGPKVIEMAPRLSGGWFCTDQIPLATGVDLLGAAIHLSLGDPVGPEDLTPRQWKGVAIRYFFPQPGKVVAIRATDRARAMPGVHRLGLFVGTGDELPPTTDHTRRAGFVITTGSSRDEAVERACNVVDTVVIETV